VAQFHRRTDAGDYDSMAGINEATENLVRERDVLDKVSTWPWEPETVCLVLTAFLARTNSSRESGLSEETNFPAAPSPTSGECDSSSIL
jgi:hypothetical protein